MVGVKGDSSFRNPINLLFKVYHLLVFMHTFREWAPLSEADRRLILTYQALHKNAEDLVSCGFLLKKQEDGRNYYRVPAQLLNVVGFGKIDFTDPGLIKVYIDPFGRFIDRVRRGNTNVVWVGERDV